MAQMERNVNLEEIDSDALFGIDALKGQSILQKILFFACLGLGIIANVCMPMFLNTPRAVCVLIFLGLIMIGIAFGCNYTQDMTYGQYLYCYFFKPVKTLRYESTEDIVRIKKKAEELKKEEELQRRKEKNADPKAQKKLLIKLLVFVLVMAAAVISVLIYVRMIRPKSYHHEVIIEEEVELEQEIHTDNTPR